MTLTDTPPRDHAAGRRAGKPSFQWLRVVFALVLRDMGTRFGKSSGGYFWAIAEPLGGILMLSLVFGMALRRPPMGESFMMFYASGVITFSMYSTVSGGVSSAINSNKSLLTYPVVTVLDAVLAKFLLNFLTVCVIAAVLFSSIILSLNVPVTLDFGAILLALFLAALLGLGVGSVNCVLIGFFPTWKNIWSVLSRPLYLLSGIFYIYETMPGALKTVLWYNPIVHLIALMRSGFYGFYHPHFISYSYVVAISMITFVIGAYLMRRHTSFLLEK